MIELKQVNKTFESKKGNFQALSNIDLRLDDRMCYGIVGYSGAGKSTLVRLLNGLIKPSSGQILIDGIDLTKLKPNELNTLRKQMGMVFQSDNLLSQLSVYENIKLALQISNYPKDERHERILEVLNLVGLLDKKDNYPKELSGGQRQRVGIARAISFKPKYLLCDEITSALDPNTALEVVKLLNEIKEKESMTIVFISHQMEIVREIADQIVVMENGRIVEQKSTVNLFINPQKEISKKLLRQEELDFFRGDDVYQLIYDAKNVYESLLSTMIQTYQVRLSILHAETLKLKGHILGRMIIRIEGKNDQESLDYLRNHGVKITEFNKEER